MPDLMVFEPGEAKTKSLEEFRIEPIYRKTRFFYL